MQNIICLDIDDCILPSNVNYFGKTDDALHILEINLKRLKMILDKYEMKVFITSSWYILLELDSKNIILKSDRNDTTTLIGFGLIKKYIGKYIIGLSNGDRSEDIEKLKSEGNKVVILDDWDLKKHQDENCLYVSMCGFIDGNVGFMINSFMKYNKLERRMKE